VTDTPLRKAEPAPTRRVPTLWGPLSSLGLVVAVIACVLDQAAKLWIVNVFDLGHRGAVHILPLIDLILTRNTGISYGWLQQEGPFGQWALLVLKGIAVILLWFWLARAHGRLTAVALGLIIGGAIGNAIDRIAYGSVVDFIFLHHWYVFNLADVAIVAGVVGLLYEAVLGDRAAKAPRSGG
jgi:signal peptidase II